MLLSQVGADEGAEIGGQSLPYLAGGIADAKVVRPYSGPLMPPSLRTRQKWIASSSDTASGMAMQCKM
jgi:hypothetical protein